jgi:CRISPR-associated protein Csb2
MPLRTVDKPKVFVRVLYSSTERPIGRPSVTFRLLDENGDTVRYPQAKLVHIAGMVRHLAIERMRANPPHDLRGRDPAQWLRAYVSGHQPAEGKASGAAHAQFSYVPLQSVGAAHTDPSVRRVMIIAPVGDEQWLGHLAEQLDGLELKPLPNTNLPQGTRLERISEKSKDGVRDSYVGASRAWASVTPVILPGHDDHKPEKTRRLIEKALAQSGMDQPCEFEWSAFSRFPKMLSAHRYRRDSADPTNKIRINYVRPDHLLEQSAVHLMIRFGRREAPGVSRSDWIPAVHPVPGPICIGAGRHCGFGVMASVCD